MTTDSYYDILGIDRNATHDEIKAAYRAMAAKYHPDRNPGSASETNEIFKRVNRAYEVLGDPIKRAVYDRELRTGVAPNASRPQQTPQPTRGAQPPSSVAGSIKETVEGLLRTTGPEEVRKAFAIRAIRNSRDKKGLDELSQVFQWGDDREYLLRGATMECEVRIAAGLRVNELEEDHRVLFERARNGKNHSTVMAAAGQRFAEVATKADLRYLAEFSRSPNIQQDYATSTSAGAYTRQYDRNDPRRAARTAAGLKYTELEDYLPRLLEEMKQPGHYIEVRNALGIKAVGMETNDAGIMRMYTEAEDLPAVRDAIMQKLNTLDSVSQQSPQPARPRATPPPLPAAARKVRQ